MWKQLLTMILWKPLWKPQNILDSGFKGPLLSLFKARPQSFATGTGTPSAVEAAWRNKALVAN